MVHAAFTDAPYYNDINSMVIFSPLPPISLNYLLAVINSKLLSFWFSKTFDKLQGGRYFSAIQGEGIAGSTLSPFTKSPMNVAADTRGRDDRLVSMAEQMLQLA